MDPSLLIQYVVLTCTWIAFEIHILYVHFSGYCIYHFQYFCKSAIIISIFTSIYIPHEAFIIFTLSELILFTNFFIIPYYIILIHLNHATRLHTSYAKVSIPSLTHLHIFKYTTNTFPFTDFHHTKIHKVTDTLLSSYFT